MFFLFLVATGGDGVMMLGCGDLVFSVIANDDYIIVGVSVIANDYSGAKDED